MSETKLELVKLPRRGGRPLTAAGKQAKSMGIETRVFKRSGLDRDVSPLVRTILLNRIKRTKA